MVIAISVLLEVVAVGQRELCIERGNSHSEVRSKLFFTFFLLPFIHNGCSQAVRQEAAGVRGDVATDRRLLQSTDVADVL